MKKSLFYLSLALVLLGFGALIAAPETAAAGARRGLSVCAGVIVPSLFPFLTGAGLLAALGLPGLLAAAAAPLTQALFGVSGQGAVPLLLGLMGGYPAGAAAIGELVDRGELSPEEGTRLLPFCNNTGPAFILGAAGGGVFRSPRAGVLLYLSHILAAAVLGVLLSLPRRKNRSRPCAGSIPRPPEVSLARALPGCVGASVRAVGNICGFVVLFSAFTALLEDAGVFSFLALAAAEHTAISPAAARAALTGLLELGSGIAAMEGFAPSPPNLALAAFLLGFGGLSVHCQTLSVLEGSGVKLGPHFPGRLAHGLLSAAIVLGLCGIFSG